MESKNSLLSKKQGYLSTLILFITFGFFTIVVFGRYFSIFLMTFSTEFNATATAIMAGLVQVFLSIVILVPLIFILPNPTLRRYFASWLAATVFVLVLIPIHLVNPTAAQTRLFVQSVVFFMLIIVTWIIIPRILHSRIFFARSSQEIGEVHPDKNNQFAYRIALVLPTMLAIPWALWGALGSLLDTVLGLVFALLFGGAAAQWISSPMFSGSGETDKPTFVEFLNKIFAQAGFLLILCSALTFGFGGMQLILLFIIPSLAWIVPMIIPSNQQYLASHRGSIFSVLFQPISLLVGLTAAAPILFIDPDELFLVITFGPGELIAWAAKATGASIAIIYLFIPLILLISRLRNTPSVRMDEKREQSISTKFLLLTVNACLSLILIVFLIFGQPGFSGERMFVVLKDTVDVSSASQIEAYDLRRQEVYIQLTTHAESTQAEIRMVLDRLGIHYTPYYLVNAIELPGNPLLRLWLKTRPEIDRILDSPRLRPLPEFPATGNGSLSAPVSPQWNQTSIGADKVWQEFGITGQGIVVGQADSGVQGDHPELATSYRGANGNDDYNWLDPWNFSETPEDRGGHGTHTLGSILGKNVGVAPGAQWIGCVNLSRNLGNPALYLNCLQFLFAPYPKDGDPFHDGLPGKGAHIFNNSWGCPELEGCDLLTFRQAVQALRDAGVFVVVSAGNNGPACTTITVSPATHQEVFSVGAVDQNGQLASFSSIGPATDGEIEVVKPDILAPGVAVLSSLPGSSYGESSGTSMSGPHVSGTVALLWSANPLLIGDIDRTTAILHETASLYKGSLPDCPGAASLPSTATGYGLLDAYTAVKSALNK